MTKPATLQGRRAQATTIMTSVWLPPADLAAARDLAAAEGISVSALLRALVRVAVRRAAERGVVEWPQPQPPRTLTGAPSRDAIFEAVPCAAWSTTAQIAAATPWSTEQVYEALCLLYGSRRVERRPDPAHPSWWQWRCFSRGGAS